MRHASRLGRGGWVGLGLCLFGCASAPSAPSVSASGMLRRDVVAFPAPVPVEIEDEPAPPALPEAVIALLPWPAPPSSVGCLIEGRNDVARGLTVLDEDAEPVATIQGGELTAVWGIPRASGEESSRGRVWVHAQSKGVGVTGHLDEGLRLVIAREVEVVAGHAWIEAHSPVSPLTTSRDGKVSIATLDGLPGTEKLRGRVSCEMLSETPVVPASSVDEPEAPTSEADPTHFAKGTLALSTKPGAKPFVELEAEGHGLEVVERRGTSLRIKFDAPYMRFDAWVEADAVTTTGPGSGFAACGGGPMLSGSIAPWVLRRTTVARLGIFEPREATASGVTLAEGTPVRVVHRVGGLWAVRPDDSAIRAPGSNDYWVTEDAVGHRDPR